MQERYHHIAHCKEIFVVKGEFVEKGQRIATVGNTGKSTSAHVHWEIHKQKPTSWTTYTKGLIKLAIQDKYYNPQYVIDTYGAILPLKDSRVTGYDWLDSVYDNKGQFLYYHPGWDENIGAKNDDEGMDLVAPEAGEIVYMNLGYCSGWGNHFFIKINDNKLMPNQVDELKKYTDTKIAALKEEILKVYDKKINKLKNRKWGATKIKSWWKKEKKVLKKSKK